MTFPAIPQERELAGVAPFRRGDVLRSDRRCLLPTIATRSSATATRFGT